MFIWDYLANFHSYMMPHPNIGSIAPNIRLFAENGAVGVFEQGDALCSAGSFATLRHYVAAHLLWNPQDDENRLIDEFLNGYYGTAAAPFLKKFIAVVEAGPRKTRQAVPCYHKGAPFLDADDKLKATQLMDEAVAAAEKEGGPFASRVRRERLSIDHMLLLNYDILRKLAARQKMPWTRPATKAEAVENWIRDVKSFGVKARRETTRVDEIDNYFNSLRNGKKPAGNVWGGAPDASASPAKLPDIGFALYMTTPATNAPEKVVSSSQMKSRTVEEKDGRTCIVWRGHPLCGGGFTVTAALTPTPE